MALVGLGETFAFAFAFAFASADAIAWLEHGLQTDSYPKRICRIPPQS